MPRIPEAPAYAPAEALHGLSRELRELDIGDHICRVQQGSRVDPLEFYRRFVGSNKPALLEEAASSWPAVQLWTNEYLSSAMGEHEVTVACTPDGRADSITKDDDGQVYFALPHEKRLPLAHVLRHFAEERQGMDKEEVLYIQSQNNAFKTEYSPLLKDVPGLPWANTAFGHEPDAVNIWIGNHRSVTSFHKDQYENIYVVLSGVKRFTLLPPCDRFRLDMWEVPVARYSADLQLEPEQPRQLITWAAASCLLAAKDSASILHPDLLHEPSLPKPLVVEVHAGEALYLPSMWWHMVGQEDDGSGRVIALNYWFDMQYDCKYAYAQFLGKLSGVTKQDEQI